MEAKHVEAEEGGPYDDIIRGLPEEARPMGKRGKHSYTLKKDGCMGRIEVLSGPKFIMMVNNFYFRVRIQPIWCPWYYVCKIVW